MIRRRLTGLPANSPAHLFARQVTKPVSIPIINQTHQTMKSLTSLLFVIALFTVVGCGGDNKPPSPDEIKNFLEENPDVVEATARANAAENLEDEGF